MWCFLLQSCPLFMSYKWLYSHFGILWNSAFLNANMESQVFLVHCTEFFNFFCDTSPSLIVGPLPVYIYNYFSCLSSNLIGSLIFQYEPSTVLNVKALWWPSIYPTKGNSILSDLDKGKLKNGRRCQEHIEGVYFWHEQWYLLDIGVW